MSTPKISAFLFFLYSMEMEKYKVFTFSAEKMMANPVKYMIYSFEYVIQFIPNKLTQS